VTFNPKLTSNVVEDFEFDVDERRCEDSRWPYDEPVERFEDVLLFEDPDVSTLP